MRVSTRLLGHVIRVWSLMIHSCHYLILYSFFLPKSGGTQLHCWICSHMVYYYLGTQLYGNQSIQYWVFGEITAAANLFATVYHDVVTTSYPLLHPPHYNLRWTTYFPMKNGVKRKQSQKSVICKVKATFIGPPGYFLYICLTFLPCWNKELFVLFCGWIK